MARPISKNVLFETSLVKYEKLCTIINSMTEAELSTEFDFSHIRKKQGAHWQRDRNVRDILMHLYEWHQLLLYWIRSNMNGQKIPFLPSPYNWKTYGEMNVAFWQKHQSTKLEDAKKQFQSSHQAVMSLIDTFSNDQLFSKQFFDWTGTTTLGNYCISATSSHYDWAIKKLRSHIRHVKGTK